MNKASKYNPEQMNTAAVITENTINRTDGTFVLSSPVDSYGAFPLHGTVRFGTAQFGLVCISTAV